jgi:tRNA-dependent cyclodipeptide synthase
MSTYKVKVTHSGGWQDHDTARIAISLKNPKQQGKKFDAIIDWLTPRFNHVVIQLADTLHRHNIAIDEGLDLKAAHKRAVEYGDIWLESHHHLFDKLPSHQVIRWVDRLTQIDINTYYPQLEQIMHANDNTSANMRKYIDDYMLRRKFVSDNEKQAAYNASRNYVLEESAIYLGLFETERAAEIYPGSYLPLPEHPNKSFTSIDFIRKRGPR